MNHYTDCNRFELAGACKYGDPECPAMRYPSLRVLPVVQGDWVAERSHSSHITIARVRQAYWDGDEVLADLVFYDVKGVKHGRASPDMGGPKTFEPCCTLHPDRWQRIDAPDFPLKTEQLFIPCEDKPGMCIMHMSLYHPQGLKTKAPRIKTRKQSSDYPRRRTKLIFIEKEPGNQAATDASGMRRAAQELRDAARLVDTLSGSVLRVRATRLEEEAEKLSPRGG